MDVLNYHELIGQSDCNRCSRFPDIICDDCKDNVANRVVKAAYQWWLNDSRRRNQPSSELKELAAAVECFDELNRWENAGYNDVQP